MEMSVWWGVFSLLILCVLIADLGFFHRRVHTIRLKEAMGWTLLWIIVTLLFNGAIYLWMDSDKALAFLTGYLIEKSLSIDNMFVFILIFQYFSVPSEYQHRILFWGILGAIIMRGLLIWLGVQLIETFEWIIYIFGIFLIYTGYKMAFQERETINPLKNPVLKAFRKIVPLTPTYEKQAFFVIKNGVLYATPLFLVLLMIESTDLVFAVDSIPAIFAITRDPFIIYTSNIFAILGLRALYFVLVHFVGRIEYLKIGISIILVYVGIKMLLSEIYEIPTLLSLGIIGGILLTTTLISFYQKKKEEKNH